MRPTTLFLFVFAFVFILFFSTNTYCQLNFEKINYLTENDSLVSDFKVLDETFSSYADVDNDGDEDLLLCGGPCDLYLNNGYGGFEIDYTNSFDNLQLGVAKFADIDNDNDEDLIISDLYKSQVLKNDGSGQFTKMSQQPIPTVIEGSIDVGDVDGDGDFDLLIGGYNGTRRVVELFANNGAGLFSLKQNNFRGFINGKIQFIDVDNDGDLDIFESGYNTELISEFYLNDGLGNFTVDTTQNIIGFYESDFQFADFNNNGYSDLIISGKTSTQGNMNPKTMIYFNNAGNFNLADSTSFIDSTQIPAPVFGKFQTLDLNKDQNLDIIFNSGIRFLNDGLGAFSHYGKDTTLSLHHYTDKVSSFYNLDLDSDGDKDLIRVPFDNSFKRKTSVFLNDSNDFKYYENGIMSSLFPLDFVDFDNDNLADIITSQNSSVYKQQKINRYKESQVKNLNGITNSLYEISFDFNNDNLEDFLSFQGQNLNIYQNYGADSIAIISTLNIRYDFYSTRVKCIDINMDGYLDLAISTKPSIFSSTITLSFYLNNGSGQFSPHHNQYSYKPKLLENLELYNLDIDGDSDQDLIFEFIDTNNTLKAVKILNIGQSMIDSPFSFPLSGLNRMAQKSFGDVDQDGDDDMLIHGYPLELYKNDGQGNFYSFDDTTFMNLHYYSISIFKDLNDDEYPELIYMSRNDGLLLFNNDSSGIFSLAIEDSTESYSQLMVKDIDNDLLPEIILFGHRAYFNDVGFQIYQNKFCKKDTTNIVESACNEFIWDGTKLNNSGTYFKHYQNINLCDSVVILDLDITTTDFAIENIHECSDSYTWKNGITYTTNNYSDSIIYTNQFSCDSIIKLNLTLNEKDTTLNKIVSCYTPFKWIDGNNYSQATNSPTFTYQNQYGCDSLIQLNLEFESINDSIYVIDNTLYAISDSASYQWLNCDYNYSRIPIATLQNYIVSDTGNYAVELTKGSCKDTSDCILVNFTGLMEQNFFNSFKLYPNPNSKNITISLGKPSRFNLVIFDAKGREVFSQKNIETSEYNLPHNFEEGIYLLHLISDKSSFSHKFIVKK